MKLVFLIGAGAVGKMTVGQSLAAQTGLRLFHNHMSIEPVCAIFGGYNGTAIRRFREVVFEEFAKTDEYGMIFTYIWAFDQPEDRAYIEHVRAIFERLHPGTEFYYVELTAPLEVRLERNRTENRLANKPSKRDVAFSEERIRSEEAAYRCVSLEGEFPFQPYLRLDNSVLSPTAAAEKIRAHFQL